MHFFNEEKTAIILQNSRFKKYLLLTHIHFYCILIMHSEIYHSFSFICKWNTEYIVDIRSETLKLEKTYQHKQYINKCFGWQVAINREDSRHLYAFHISLNIVIYFTGKGVRRGNRSYLNWSKNLKLNDMWNVPGLSTR